TPEQQVLPACLEQNLGVLARAPLASGLLSGKYQPGATFTHGNDVRSHRDDAEMQARLKQAQEIQQTEVPSGVAMAPWALAWCLQHPAVTCAIPGCKTVEQVEINASAADLAMVREDHPQAII
ncbi:MAG: aldo/keto reductase, partial [Chloroflexi bacterium]|nr:aldo/keto reductase [Chloroflexota bacterium]